MTAALPTVAPSDNPLAQIDDLPAFDAIRPDHVGPAIRQLLEHADAALTRVVADEFPADWGALSAVLDVATERLGRAWGSVSHLNSVADSPELRAAFNEMLPLVTAFWTRLGADERLYRKYKAIASDALNAEQRQALTNALRGFVLGGAELQADAKDRFAAIQAEHAEHAQKFSENTLDATDAYRLVVEPERLAGVPEDVVQAAQQLASQSGASGCALTLKMPCYLPVMQFAHDRDLRETLYRANVTRASDQAPAEQAAWDNTPVMQRLLALRQEEAELLGHPTYAHLSLVPKMAQSPEQVVGFLRDLAQKARPHAERDVNELRQYAREHLGLNDPQAWDWPYVSERLKEARYAFSEQEVKTYFPLPQVLQGLFHIVQTLFGIRMTEDRASVWHPDVRFYRIERDGTTVGRFYLDVSARHGKRSGAWMDDVCTRWRRPDTQRVQTPVAHLVCNFADGVDGKPPLLTHDDVITLFHEFGHGLHHLLSQVDERDVSGINGVEWDAVELPSQFMENFCWEWDVLQRMTAHVDTGEPMPRALYEKMLAAKNFQSGLQTLRQVEFALFDMQLHLNQAPRTADGSVDVMALLDRVRAEVAVLMPPGYSRTPHTFGHIFSGGYSAGYYSYKWAEVLSADAYAAFEEAAAAHGGSTVDATTGRAFLDQILSVGGSRPAMASFTAFRGREPTLDALLRHQGMAAA